MPGAKRGERPAALDEFMAALRTLREQAGKPSFRHMAAKSGAVSHSTLHLTVTGHRLQPWETVREFVRACDGDEVEWHARFERVSQQLREDSKHPADAAAGSDGLPVADDQGNVHDSAPGNPDHTVHAQESVEGRSLTSSDESEPTHDNTNHRKGAPHRARWRGAKSLVTASIALLASVSSVIVYMSSVESADGDANPTSEPTGSNNPHHNEILHVGDASGALDDVTYPDGTVVPTNSKFTKVWELPNVGSVEWRDRSLRRIDLPIGPDDCKTPRRVPVPDTSPGEKARITVEVRTPSKAPVHCKVHWKMIDEAEQMVLPGYRPIFFEVRVR